MRLPHIYSTILLCPKIRRAVSISIHQNIYWVLFVGLKFSSIKPFVCLYDRFYPSDILYSPIGFINDREKNKPCLGGTGGRIIFVKFNGGLLLLLLFKKLGC